MKYKWYLQTWFIAVLFLFWQLLIPPVIGIVLIIKQRSFLKKQEDVYGDVYDARKECEEKEKEIKDLNKRIASLKIELSNLRKDTFVEHYNFSNYEGITSEECKNKLVMLRQKSKELIKSDKAIVVDAYGTKKEINDNKKQIIRCFNAECDNVLVNLNASNIDSGRKKVAKSFETINSIFKVDGMELSDKMLELKLEEINLVYTYELKRQQEKEQQKAIKEQMIEEEKVRREIEREKKKIEKDQAQCSSEINRLMKYMQSTQNDIEKQLYIDKIKELEEKLKQLEKDKEYVLEREANATAGYVYIISNIGSFGEDVYKIGMTRRLEPMDRVKELSSASVPFEFDVHAMIFSDDAPKLESKLHEHFKKKSVNKVNYRKEFFRVSLDEIEDYVKSNYNNTAEFTKVPLATEYRETLRITGSQLQ